MAIAQCDCTAILAEGGHQRHACRNYTGQLRNFSEKHGVPEPARVRYLALNNALSALRPNMRYATDWAASYSRNAFMGEKKQAAALVAVEAITSRIVVVRGQKVMLDMDLAGLYGVTTKRLNEQARRNLDRFPSDFVFQLTVQEVAVLRSQFATSRMGLPQRVWGGRRYSPYAFTEHGAIMAAMVLNSARAIEISVYVVRAFVQQRGVLVASTELAKRLDELESRIERKLSTHDQAIAGILNAIRQLMAPPEPAKKRRIGFVQSD